MYREELERILNSSYQAYELTKYINDDIFMEEFVEFTRPAFIRAKNSYNVDKDTERAIFMAFTFVALKHYDGKLWEHVYGYYESPELTQRDIYNKIRINIFSQWVRGYHCDTSKREQTYQIPVIESIIPFGYATKYIDFVFDIYEKCFQYSLENVDEELDLFFDATRNLLQNDDGKSDTFENKDSDGSSKTYVLIQGTKRILKYPNFKNKVKQLKEFTKQFLLRLDNYYGQQGTIESNYYFDKAFEEWVKEHPEIRVKKSIGVRETYLKNRKPRFFLNTNTGKVYLKTPMLHTLKRENPYKIKIHVYENGSEIYCLPAHISDMMSLIEVGYQEVEIENPLNNISCTITYEDEILYPTNDAYKEALYRNNIFFNNEKEIKPNSNFNGKLYVICRNESAELDFVKRMPNYLICKFEVSEENHSFIIDSNHYSFKSSFDSEILGDICKPMVIDSEIFDVRAYRKIKSIVLISKNKSVKGNYIKVNDNILKEEFYEVREQKNNIAYILDVAKLFYENGFYSIKLIDKSNNHIVDDYSFILDSNLRLTESIIDEDCISCSFTSSYLIEDSENSVVSSYENAINSFENEYFFINVNGFKFKFSLRILVPYYILDNGNKMLFGSETSISKIDLNSVIYFYNTKDNVKLRFGDNIRNILVKNTDGQKYIELSELKNHDSEDFVEIVFYDDANEEYKIVVYNKPVFDKEQTNVFFDAINQNLTIVPYIHGFDTIDRIVARIITDETSIEDLVVESNMCVIQRDLDSSKHIVNIKIGYDVAFIDYDNGTFDEVRKFVELCDEKYIYTPLDSLIGRPLFVKYVICKNEDAEPETVRPPLFIRLLTKQSNNSYICDSYHDNSCSFSSKLGSLLIEFEPMYIAETNNKRRLNATIFSNVEGLNRPLFYDAPKVELSESKWSEEIDYFVIEEDTPW